MSLPSQSPLEAHKEKIERWVLTGWSLTEIANELRTTLKVDTSRHSVRRAIRRWGIVSSVEGEERPGFEVKGDSARVTGEPTDSNSMSDPDVLLIERGLDPKEWVVDHVKVNEWDALGGEGETVTLRQLTVFAKRRKPVEFVYPAIHIPPVRTRTRLWTPRKQSPDSKLVVFVGDQQAPYQDERLHELFLDWLDYNDPEEGILIGDTLDLPDISRHPDNPEWHVPVQECVNSGYRLLRDYVEASTTSWTKLMGNHDERIRTRLLNLATRLYDLRPADTGKGEQRPVWDIANLLHLDALGVQLVDPGGNYEHGQVKVSPYLAARHGWIARKGSGASALATLDHLGYSVFVGHTHRQSRVHKTKHDINGEPTTLTAIETGCMCKIKEGLGYTTAPDWQQGFATATVWPDGTFSADLATYVNENLYWRDQRFQ